MIFISPNLPLNEQNQIINQNDRSTQAMQDLGQHAPPMYGEHQFDQLYSSVDPSGFMTPADGRSGVNTPYASESRNASSENLASMNAVAQGTFSAHVLQGRLHNIQDHGSSRFARDRSHVVTAGTPGPGSLSNEVTDEESSHRTGTHVDSVSGAGGSNSHHNHSDPILRRASDDEQSPSGSHTPHAQHLEIDEVNEIYRLPSYGRAVRTPVRTPANEGPPTYQAALRSTSSTPPLPLPQLPTQAHTTGSSSYFREPRTSTSTGDASPPLQREYRS